MRRWIVIGILVSWGSGCTGDGVAHVDGGAEGSSVLDASAGSDAEASISPIGFPSTQPDCGSTQSLLASSYDQSCMTDSDCSLVGQGLVCYPCSFQCPSAAINVDARAQYAADLAKTPVASEILGIDCHCPKTWSGPCCVNGKCHADLLCSSSAADAGAHD